MAKVEHLTEFSKGRVHTNDRVHPTRLLSLQSRYSLRVRQVTTCPSTPKASAASLPPRLLQLLPTGAKVAGWGSHPLGNCASHGAEVNEF